MTELFMSARHIQPDEKLRVCSKRPFLKTIFVISNIYILNSLQAV